MKNLSLTNKLLFIVNTLLATLLLIAYISRYISPETISFLSLFSLITPLLILINSAFSVYWLVLLKRQFMLSTIVLLIGYQQVNALYNIQEKKVFYNSDVKIMSYNVRLFNLYNWIDNKGIDEKIKSFIEEKKPSILCVQEYYTAPHIAQMFPYKYTKINPKKKQPGLAIFSKLKIINYGSLNFENSNNNAIFIDVVKLKDTIRIYNVHLQSLKVNPEKETLSKENSEKLRVQIQKAFKKQAHQVALLVKHQKNNNYKSILCGDFNNTAFSWAYRKLKSDKKDAFVEAGEGFGKTMDFMFPFRIDFILTDEKIKIHNFKTYNVKYSDHFPIMARVKF
ncbi:endonuclease/exonuclease/phosphatase family protein [Lutibacter sp.]